MMAAPLDYTDEQLLDYDEEFSNELLDDGAENSQDVAGADTSVNGSSNQIASSNSHDGSHAALQVRNKPKAYFNIRPGPGRLYL